MASTIGEKIRVTVFGQSHSKAIGCTVEGIPAGQRFSLEQLYGFMERRAPGRNKLSTQRKESDRPEFLSGVLPQKEEGSDELITCGTPMTAVIFNGDCRSKDYENLRCNPRPGHADYTAQIKYGGSQDIRGGGHFSGRLTAPLCVAGGIIKQILKARGIEIAAHISSIGSVQDERFDAVEPGAQMSRLQGLSLEDFPTLSKDAGERMKALIDACRLDQDSIGGTIECAITGLEAGVGDPMFDGVENQMARAIFGIPACKGLEFGAGFQVSEMRGSQNNDSFTMKDGKVRTLTNNHGGILGGITSGMPVIFRAAFKPTPSISRPQQTVNLTRGEDTTLEITGRHDPCIVHRAVPVVEAVAAIVIYDMLNQ